MKRRYQDSVSKDHDAFDDITIASITFDITDEERRLLKSKPTTLSEEEKYVFSCHD